MAQPVHAKYLDIPQAAQVVGVDPRTIRNWIAAGRITGYRFGPKLLRVLEADVLALGQPVPTAGDAS